MNESNHRATRLARAAAMFGRATCAVVLAGLLPALASAQTPDSTSKATSADSAALLRGTGADTAGAKKAANPEIRIVVEKRGDIVVELFPDKAPKACARILELVREGFYNGLPFHRVEPYLVQTGARQSKIAPVEGEMFSQRMSHDRGMVGMARLPNDYDSATTQFYIMKERRPLLNSEYTLFGRVVRGMDVVDKIKKGDRIASVTIVGTE